MARPLRMEYPNAVYHVTSRGNDRNKIFLSDQDREHFLSVLGAVVKRFHWLCHAHCLMDNHYHLLIETPDANLSRGMRQLNGVYTQKYNGRHGKTGHVFQGRYQSIVVEKGHYLLELCRYVVLNPVRADMVQKPDEWKWSSYEATAGLKAVPDYLTASWILKLFSSNKKEAQRRYRTFVREGIKQSSPWGDLQGQILLGKEGFVDTFKDHLTDKEHCKEIPRVQRYVNRPPLSKLFLAGENRAKRNKHIYTAHIQNGYTLKEIADHLEIHYTTASKAIRSLDEK